MTSEEHVAALAAKIEDAVTVDGDGAEIDVENVDALCLRDVLARLERAEEDSRRLDWIEANTDNIAIDADCGSRGPFCVTHWCSATAPSESFYGPTLRDTIDAARKEADRDGTT